MNRIKYEQYHGAAGYDAVARKKIKELEEKVGSGGSGGGIKNVIYSLFDTGTHDLTNYIGDYPNGDYSIVTEENIKEMVDHYGFVLCRWYEDGTLVKVGMINGYEITDGEFYLWWP